MITRALMRAVVVVRAMAVVMMAVAVSVVVGWWRGGLNPWSLG